MKGKYHKTLNRADTILKWFTGFSGLERERVVDIDFSRNI